MIDLSRFVSDEYQMGCLAISPQGYLYTDDQGKILEIDLMRDQVVARHTVPFNKISHIRYERGKLVCTYFKFYDPEGYDKPSVFTYDPIKQKIVGQHRLVCPFAVNTCQRGGTVLMPNGTMAVGFGGYYSIFQGGSYGPFLATWKEVLLDHRETRALRPAANYWVRKQDEGTWVGNNDGRWTAADRIGGDDRCAGVVRSGDKILFFAQLGLGEIGYWDGGVRASNGWAPYLYIYDVKTKVLTYKEYPEDVRGVCWYDRKLWGYVWPHVKQLKV